MATTQKSTNYSMGALKRKLHISKDEKVVPGMMIKKMNDLKQQSLKQDIVKSII